MTPQELRSSILQLAIQGRLVPQRPEEGTAEELYRQIQSEKQSLIQSGKIKKEKPLPEITEEEIPFDIPESWKWVRLRNIVYNRGQETPITRFSYIDIGSINNKQQCLNEDETIIEAENATSRARKLVDCGDILYSTVRPYLHNMCIINRSFSCKPIASTGFAVMTCFSGIYNKYLFYFLMSPIFDSYANATENAKGVAYPAINDNRLYQGIIPLPPLAEQKRIVAKIEELLPLVDRYEQAWQRLEVLNSRFPVDMQKSVLQLAIQGRLVPQRPEEGTAEELFRQIQSEKQSLIQSGKIKKEKPLPEITEDEISFDIPESWKWVRLSELMYSISTGPFGSMLHKADYVSDGIPLVNPANIVNGRIVPSEKMMITPKTRDRLSSYILRNGMIVMGRRGEMGRCAVVTDLEDGWLCGTGSFFMEPSIELFVNYLSLFFRTPFAKAYLGGESVGTTMNNLNHKILRNLPVPLPPLAEQKRIVARLEELLPLCEKLR